MSADISAASAPRIAVVGLGYVGLPLAVEFGRTLDTLGYDIDATRVAELRQGHDRTLELDAAELAAATCLRYCADAAELARCNVFVVTVPTPIDAWEQPDLEPLRAASQLIAGVLKRGDLVIYESTVYPGTTEEVCVPLLEQGSGLRFNQDFWCGYSPERINPGDRQRRLPDIRKITSGSTPEAAEVVDALYRRIIAAGTWRAPSLRVAEAAKVVENIQRDVNIALVNELALIFDRLGIDTLDVLEAAGTKWNFLPFRPGMVGGHCIGVDPYYLTHKAQSIGYHPEIILAGRRLNDAMGGYVVSQLVKAMTQRRIHVQGARVLVMGLTFKENCPDLRNTRIVDIVKELGDYNVNVDVYDPWVQAEEAVQEYGITPLAELEDGKYDAVILGVAHRQFKAMGAAGIRKLGKPEHILYDLKYVLLPAESDLRL